MAPVAHGERAAVRQALHVSEVVGERNRAVHRHVEADTVVAELHLPVAAVAARTRETGMREAGPGRGRSWRRRRGGGRWGRPGGGRGPRRYWWHRSGRGGGRHGGEPRHWWDWRDRGKRGDPRGRGDPGGQRG